MYEFHKELKDRIVDQLNKNNSDSKKRNKY